MLGLLLTRCESLPALVELSERWRAARDESALSALIALAMPLIRFHARRWQRWCLPHVTREDLVQAGRVGVWRFAEKGNGTTASLNLRIKAAIREASCARRSRNLERQLKPLMPPGGLVYLDAPVAEGANRPKIDYVAPNAEGFVAGIEREDLVDWIAKHLWLVGPGAAANIGLALNGCTKAEIARRRGVREETVRVSMKTGIVVLRRAYEAQNGRRAR